MATLHLFIRVSPTRTRHLGPRQPFLKRLHVCTPFFQAVHNSTAPRSPLEQNCEKSTTQRNVSRETFVLIFTVATFRQRAPPTSTAHNFLYKISHSHSLQVGRACPAYSLEKRRGFPRVISLAIRARARARFRQCTWCGSRARGTTVRRFPLQ